MGCSIPTSHIMEQLSFDVDQQSRSSNTKQFVGQPTVSKLLFDQDQPSACVFASSYSSRRFKSNDKSSFFIVFSDSSKKGLVKKRNYVRVSIPRYRFRFRFSNISINFGIIFNDSIFCIKI